MVTATKEKSLSVVLPDLGEVIADVIEAYAKQLAELYPDHLISSDQAEKYTHTWLDMQYERGKSIRSKREYDLAELSFKNRKMPS